MIRKTALRVEHLHNQIENFAYMYKRAFTYNDNYNMRYYKEQIKFYGALYQCQLRKLKSLIGK